MRVQGKGPVEERRRKAADRPALARRLLLQRRDIAQRIDAASTAKSVVSIERLTRMRFDQQPALIKAHELLISPCGKDVSHVPRRELFRHSCKKVAFFVATLFAACPLSFRANPCNGASGIG
jgi:hypothetical protein